MVEFSFPAAWWLIVLLPLLWVLQRKSLANLQPGQARCLLGLRMFIGLCLITALAGPIWLRSSDRQQILFLQDVSASISPANKTAADQFVAAAIESMRTGDRWERLFFARKVKADEMAAPDEWPDEEKLGTDLAQAIRVGEAALADGYVPRLVLISDGADTENSSLAEVTARLIDRSLPVDTMALSPSEIAEVLVDEIQTPPVIRPREPFITKVVVESNQAETADVRLYLNGVLAGQTRSPLQPGRNVVAFPGIVVEGGLARLEAEIVPMQDTEFGNNRLGKSLPTAGQAQVLLIDSNPSTLEALADALRQGGLQAEIRPPEGIPAGLDAMNQFDLVVLSDTASNRLTERQMQTMKEWVQSLGGGLIMTGGENSFGAGGYYRTPLEEMLPVRMEHEDRQENPVAALLLALDRSGSMAATVEGQTKMALANQGAALAMEVLQSKDLFGVLAVDTRVQTVLPLGPITNREEATRKILAIQSSGGGIYVFTTLAEAFRLLREVSARVKHLILFSDAADAEEKEAGAADGGSPSGSTAWDLASTMLANRITISVVALGNETDKDVEFLRGLAARGGGRFYLTSDATSLPRIFSLETMRATRSSLVEEPLQAIPGQSGGATAGIAWEAAPFLLGYNKTQTKPGSTLELGTPQGDPLLASWQFGLGKTAAFTSDAKGRWASEWLGWPGFAQFWTQLARSTMRQEISPDFQVRWAENNDQLILEVEAVDGAGLFRNDLEILAAISRPGETETANAKIPQVAPGLYSLVVDKPDEGTLLVSVTDGTPGRRPLSLSWSAGYPAELRTSQKGNAVLANLSSATGGRHNVSASEVFRPSGRRTTTRTDLAPYFLVLAALFLPIEVWLRRRDWTGHGENRPQAN